MSASVLSCDHQSGTGRRQTFAGQRWWKPDHGAEFPLFASERRPTLTARMCGQVIDQETSCAQLSLGSAKPRPPLAGHMGAEPRSDGRRAWRSALGITRSIVCFETLRGRGHLRRAWPPSGCQLLAAEGYVARPDGRARRAWIRRLSGPGYGQPGLMVAGPWRGRG